MGVRCGRPRGRDGCPDCYCIDQWYLVARWVENVFDVYPDEAINYGNGRKYPRDSPARHNGALV